MRKIIFYFLIMLPLLAVSQYQIPTKMQWWYESRFGMFIHFGSYSYFGHGEWVMFNEKWTKENYQTQISTKFYPQNFNAKQIVDVAKSTGMKYIVITAKHHEGFSMWHTNVTGFKDYTQTKPYNIYDYCNFKRDILMELKQECDKQEIKFCLYYSILDWNHSSQELDTANYFSKISSFDAKQQYITEMKAQLKELVETYNPAVMWFDGDWCKNENPPTLQNWWTQADAEDLYAYLMKLNPQLIVNERVKRELGLGDFMCPEQKIPQTTPERAWETCQTMNGTWGYNSSSEKSYNPAKTFIHELEQVVSRDGNYLLNIDPRGDGSLNPMMIEVLSECGKWLQTYGESIYDCGRNPFNVQPSWGYYTHKKGKIYAHVQQLDSVQAIQIPEISNTIIRVYELSQKNIPVNFSTKNGYIEIPIPKQKPNTISLVYMIEYEGEFAVKK